MQVRRSGDNAKAKRRSRRRTRIVNLHPGSQYTRKEWLEACEAVVQIVVKHFFDFSSFYNIVIAGLTGNLVFD